MHFNQYLKNEAARFFRISDVIFSVSVTLICAPELARFNLKAWKTGRGFTDDHNRALQSSPGKKPFKENRALRQNLWRQAHTSRASFYVRAKSLSILGFFLRKKPIVWRQTNNEVTRFVFLVPGGRKRCSSSSDHIGCYKALMLKILQFKPSLD